MGTRRIKTVGAKPVTIRVHPDFFKRIESIRKEEEKKSGGSIRLTHPGITKMFSNVDVKLGNIQQELFNANKKFKTKQKR